MVLWCLERRFCRTDFLAYKSEREEGRGRGEGRGEERGGEEGGGEGKGGWM